MSSALDDPDAAIEEIEAKMEEEMEQMDAAFDAQLEEMEAERDRITSAMQSPDYYRNADNDPLGDQAKLEELETAIAQAFETWEELEALG